MITSFFKPKGEPVAVCAAPVAAAPPRKDPENDAQSIGRKRIRKAVVQDDDDEEKRDTKAQSAPVATVTSDEVESTAMSPHTARARVPGRDAEEAMADTIQEEAEETEEKIAEEGNKQSEKAMEEEEASAPDERAFKHKPTPRLAPKGGTAALVQYHKYNPAAAVTWTTGTPVPYSFLTGVLSDIEAESKRLLMTERLANCFRTVIAVSPADLLPVVCLVANKLAPAFEGVELGIGDSIMIKASGIVSDDF